MRNSFSFLIKEIKLPDLIFVCCYDSTTHKIIAEIQNLFQLKCSGIQLIIRSFPAPAIPMAIMETCIDIWEIIWENCLAMLKKETMIPADIVESENCFQKYSSS